MQDLEHSNMDDLFRRAAENYPLKTGDSGWDAVAPQLTIVPAVAPAKKSTGRKKAAGIAILVILALATGAIAINFTGNRKTGKKQAATQESPAATQPAINNSQTQPGVINESITALPNEKIPSLIKKRNDEPVSGRQASLVKAPEHSNRLNYQKSNTPVTGQTNTEKQDTDKSATEKNETGNSIKSIHINPEKDNREQETTGENTETENKENTVETLTVKNNPIAISKGFYWGFAAGPQLNEVKWQGTKKAGFDIGLLAGYRFNSKLSLETGLFFSRKYYYSDGKYFDMAKAGPSMPAGMKILSLKGNSSVFEIPVKLKYDVLTLGRSGIYSVAGISSYLLTRENNDYNAMINGTPQFMAGNYKNNARYFAAAINLGLGYEYKLGIKNAIRIEPYLQIPLKGIGVGAMPVTSAGIHIGITRKNK